MKKKRGLKKKRKNFKTTSAGLNIGPRVATWKGGGKKLFGKELNDSVNKKKKRLKKGGLKEEKISKRCLRGWNTQPRVEPH